MPRSLMLILMLVFGIALGAEAQNGAFVTVLPESRIWLEGSSNVIDFSCNLRSLSGIGFLGDTAKPRDGAHPHDTIGISMMLPVEELDCGKRAMNSDLRNALKHDIHPNIAFALEGVGFEDDKIQRDGEWLIFEVFGELTVAGIPRHISLKVRGQPQPPNQFRVVGEYTIDMIDFQVEPPVALMGLVKADRYVTIHFDVHLLRQS